MCGVHKHTPDCVVSELGLMGVVLAKVLPSHHGRLAVPHIADNTRVRGLYVPDLLVLEQEILEKDFAFGDLLF